MPSRGLVPTCLCLLLVVSAVGPATALAGHPAAVTNGTSQTPDAMSGPNRVVTNGTTDANATATTQTADASATATTQTTDANATATTQTADANATATTQTADQDATGANRTVPTLSQTVTVDRIRHSRLVQFTHRYAVPNGTEEFAVPLDRATRPVVVNQTGFVRRGDTWVWDGETRHPRLVVVRTYATRPGALGWWDVALTDEWALVSRPPERVRGANASLPVETTLRLADEGVIGTHAIVLGPVRTVTERVAGQTISLVVPEGTTPAVDPQSALRVLEATERRLEGDPSVDSYVFVTPELPAGATTPSSGMASDSDAWVLASADYETYLHEYVHVEQRFRVGSEMSWFQEASASYLSRYLSMSLGLSGPFPFAVFSGIVGADGPIDDDTVLSDPGTWRRYTEYREGRAFLGALDARIRNASGGQWTLLDVFARLNAQNDATEAGNSDSRQQHSHVSYAEFRTTVTRLTDEETGEWLDRYARTDAWTPFPSDPDAFQYSQAYFETYPGFEPSYDLVPGAPTAVPVRLDHTDAATLRIETDDGWATVTVRDGDGDGRADVALRPTRTGGLAVRPVDDDDWAVSWGDSQSVRFSPGVHRIQLLTDDDERRFPDSVGTVRVVGDAWVPPTDGETAED